jgi:hypothetical protein
MNRAKAIFLIFSLCFPCFSLFAQVLPARTAFQSGLTNIIEHYPNQFKNLAGEVVTENPQSTDYRSVVSLKGAEECIVTKFSAKGKEVYSWQAAMLTTEDFEEGLKKYKSLYNSIQHLAVEINGTNAVLSSEFVMPTEGKKFNSIIFTVSEKDEMLKKLKVELTLQNELLEWVIKVLVYEKEREDDERGDIIDQ